MILESNGSLKSAPLLVDSHCHLDFRVFSVDRREVWRRCHGLGVAAVVIPSVVPRAFWSSGQQSYLEQTCGEVDLDFLSASLMSSKKNAKNNWHFATGLHPWWVNSFIDFLARDFVNPWRQLSDYLAQGLDHSTSCVALGESGLDFSVAKDQRQKILQLESLRVHLQLASDNKLPVILHAVKAHAELIAELKQFSGVRGVIHAFTGSYEIAREYLKLGFKLGVGGAITYNRAKKTCDAIHRTPLESLLLETDAPDMPISGRQGERNSPEYLPEIARALADLKHCSYVEVAETTTQNSLELFGISLASKKVFEIKNQEEVIGRDMARQEFGLDVLAFF